MTPKRPIHLSEIEPEVWYAGTDRELRGWALCDVGGASKLGVGVLELAPGSNTRPAHYHTKEEEHLYVLDGHATLHLGDDRYPLVPGSYVCFPAGQAAPHCLCNDGPAVFRYLMIGERIAEDRVVQMED
ncbi:MAG: cupin domain-containing protein [Pseudomonadales bacterium]